jgi:hypothetical protein
MRRIARRAQPQLLQLVVEVLLFHAQHFLETLKESRPVVHHKDVEGQKVTQTAFAATHALLVVRGYALADSRLLKCERLQEHLVHAKELISCT